MVCWRPANDSSNFLMHYAKGQTAKKHKYIKKEGNRYIYPDDNKGKNRTDQENIDAARDWRRNAPSSNRAMLTAREAQKQGFKRTENERAKFWEEHGFKPINGEYNKEVARAAAKDFARRDLQVKKAAKAAQEAGKKRTEYEKYKQEMSDAKKHDSTSMREWAKRNAEYHRGNFDKAREHEKKSDRAQKVFMKGLLGEDAQYDRSSKRKGKKVTNPTAKKNQKKAKINSIKYKIKSLPRKALKKGKKNLNALLNKIKRR